MSVLGFLSNLMKSQWLVTLPKQDANFDGQTIIITGANTGLGAEAAKYMVSHNAAKVIIACRTVSKGEVAKNSIEEETKRTNVIEVWELDLASYESIKKFGTKANAELDRLDVVICNAGINYPNFDLVNGFESQLAINVVSTFLVALLLLPKLKQTAAKYPSTTPHLTIVSSDTHWVVDLPEAKDTSAPIFSQLNDEKIARMTFRYPLSKLIEILVTREIVATVAPEDYPIIINNVNPGLCLSDLLRDQPSTMSAVTNFLFHARTAEEGTKNYIYAATAGKESHGNFISDCKVDGLSPYVTSEAGIEAGQRLWIELKEELERISPGISQNF